MMTQTELKALTDLDWGGLSVEFVRGNELMHIFNHDAANRKNLSRSICFIKSRIAWCDACAPNQFRHTVIIDDTDHSMSDAARRQVESELAGENVTLRFASGGKK